MLSISDWELEKRKHTVAEKFSPRHKAHAIDDFPVPFGPKIILRYGPGRNSTSSYVTKLCNLTRTIEPGTYLYALNALEK